MSLETNRSTPPPGARRARTLALLALLGLHVGCGTARLGMPNGSMEPTIRAGEVIRVDRGAYRGRDPERWDLVAFHPPHHQDRLWILRIVGLPGEQLTTRGTELLVDGEPLELPFPWRPLELESTDYRQGQVEFPVRVPAGEYFVLGDNAREANDSRFWGTIPRDCILGRALPPRPAADPRGTQPSSR